MKLDVIVPLYNEEENLKDFYKVVNKSLKDIEYRLIFVDDGSTDNSLKVLKKLYDSILETLAKSLRYTQGLKTLMQNMLQL